MTELMNARHELFAVLVAKGEGSIARCYQKAGFNTTTLQSASQAGGRLLKNVEVAERVRELKAAWAKEAGVTTTDVIRGLKAIAFFDPRTVFTWRTTGKGAERRIVISIKDAGKLPPDVWLAIRSIKQNANTGMLEMTFQDRLPAIVKIGEHLGMFSGESAERGTVNIEASQQIVYVDAPRHETVEEWKARVSAQRLGLNSVEPPPHVRTGG